MADVYLAADPVQDLRGIACLAGHQPLKRLYLGLQRSDLALDLGEGGARLGLGGLCRSTGGLGGLQRRFDLTGRRPGVRLGGLGRRLRCFDPVDLAR